MENFVFCPACLMKNQLGIIAQLRAVQKCYRCGTHYKKSATLISEDAVRMHVRENPGEADHLLKELEKVGKDESWYRPQ